MAWGKVDDKLHSSVKWRTTPKPARALWTTALSWCSDQLTDGLIPAGILGMLDGTKGEAAALVAAGLWEITEEGWRFHDWHDYQPSAAQEAEKRQRAADWRRSIRSVREIVIKRDGYVCGICGGAVEPDDVHIDHVRPRARGGDHRLSNLQVAHSRCNIRKGASWPG